MKGKRGPDSTLGYFKAPKGLLHLLLSLPAGLQRLGAYIHPELLGTMPGIPMEGNSNLNLPACPHFPVLPVTSSLLPLQPLPPHINRTPSLVPSALTSLSAAWIGKFLPRPGSWFKTLSGAEIPSTASLYHLGSATASQLYLQTSVGAAYYTKILCAGLPCTFF